MPKHGTPSYTPGQLAKFLGAGTTALTLVADRLGSELMLDWARNGKALEKVLLNALSPDALPALTDSFRDLLSEGWEVVENVEGEPVPISELEPVSFLKPGESHVSGKEMCSRAKEMGAAPGLGQARRFLEEQKDVPRQWHRYYLPLTGARVRTPDGYLNVPYLYWHGGRWGLKFRWLGRDWDSGARLLRRK